MGSFRRKMVTLEVAGVPQGHRESGAYAMEELENLGDKMSDMIYDLVVDKKDPDLILMSMRKVLGNAEIAAVSLWDVVKRAEGND